MTLNSSQGLTKIKNFLDKKILEVEAELNNSDSLFQKERLIFETSHAPNTPNTHLLQFETFK